MPGKPKFFSLAEIRQPVNQWICIAFIGVWCFWIVLYYFVQKAQDVGEAMNLSASVSQIIES
jgi:hypothetical protein